MHLYDVNVAQSLALDAAPQRHIPCLLESGRRSDDLLGWHGMYPGSESKVDGLVMAS